MADEAKNEGEGDPIALPMAASAGLVHALITGQPVDEILEAGHAADLVTPGLGLGPLDADAGWVSAGTGIENRDGVLYAGGLGYLQVVDGCLQVASAIVIAADGGEAHLLCLCAQRERPHLRSEWILAALQSAGVKHGIIDEVITEICRPEDPVQLQDAQLDRTAPRAVCVARATSPIPGSDGRIDYGVDLDQKAGRLLADGSIDLRERNTAVAVVAGQQVARIVQATPGQDGYDVRGDILPTTQGTDPELTPGENVRLHDSDAEPGGDVVLTSEIDGNLAVEAGSVHVRSVFAVAGDVDYEVGNIDVPGDVEIGGLVGPGFTIQAGGTITISGTVENGVTLQAGGDVLVGQGILGEKTRVFARGNVTTKFIQNSTVVAGTDVLSGSYIFNGRVRAGAGKVRVEDRGGDRGGSIVGGQVMAGQRVEVYRIGSAETDRTLVGIAVEPSVAAQVTELRQEHQKLVGQIAALQSSLGVTSPNDRQQLVRLLTRTPAEQLDDVETKLQQLRNWLDEAEGLQTRVDDIQAQSQSLLNQGRIRVLKDVYSDVQIQFGAHSRQLTQAVAGGCEFFLADEQVRWRALDADSATPQQD
jgi:uncharacterized protein